MDDKELRFWKSIEKESRFEEAKHSTIKEETAKEIKMMNLIYKLGTY